MSMYVVKKKVFSLHFKHFFVYLFPLMNSQNFVYRRLVPKNSNNLDPIHPVLSKPTCFTVLLFQFARKKKKKKPNRQCVYTLTRGNDCPPPILRPYRECVWAPCECVNERPDGKYPPSHYSLSLSQQQQQQHKYPPEISLTHVSNILWKTISFRFCQLGFISISFGIIFFAFINTWYHGFVYILVFSFSLGVTEI